MELQNQMTHLRILGKVIISVKVFFNYVTLLVKFVQLVSLCVYTHIYVLYLIFKSNLGVSYLTLKREIPVTEWSPFFTGERFETVLYLVACAVS